MAVLRGSSSILPFIPLITRGGIYFWPPRALTALKILSRGPDCSKVDSGRTFYDFIIRLRREVCLAREPLKRFAGEGYSLFFDDLMPRAESRKWFQETIPSISGLMLRFPAILESHYEEADNNIDMNIRENSNLEQNALLSMGTGLRIVRQQQPGLVMLSQELAAALLACALFCLFPNTQRRVNLLPVINFDGLFAGLCTAGESQKHKIKCIVHYFERIFSQMPHGVISFERKVLPVQDNNFPILYPREMFWHESLVFLCPLKVMERGTIEDCQQEALEVDFANKYLGGGALGKGCVQEEIRFMISPELIVGMLFLPAMEDNEAIEVVGIERFSKHKGYGSRFHFVGDYMDERPRDFYGRRKSRIVAIDALCHPGQSQFRLEKLVREVNKAFCGFLDHAELRRYSNFLKRVTINTEQFDSGHYYTNRAANVMAGTRVIRGPTVHSVLNAETVWPCTHCANLHISPYDSEGGASGSSWLSWYELMVISCALNVIQEHCLHDSLIGSNIDRADNGDCLSRDTALCHSSFNKETGSAGRSTSRDEIANGTAQRTSLERKLNETMHLYLPPSQESAGIATGNWGCGAFGGDHELKSVLQWIAASQASRPFVLYFTFGEEFSNRLKEFSGWILHHRWTVGELWNMLFEYSIQRLQRKICCSFFEWVLP